MLQPRYGLILKCLLALTAGPLMGLVLSIISVLIIYGVNSWDDAPGGGFIALFVMLFGVGCGLLGGIVLSGSIWRNRDNRSQRMVWRTARGSMLLISACAILPIVLIVPWTGPSLPSRRLISVSVAVAFAILSFLLFRFSATYLGNNAERCRQE